MVLEVACPESDEHPDRWAATLGREGVPEVLVVRRDDRLLPLYRLADDAGLDDLHALDAQAAPWAAQHAPTAPDATAAYVQFLVARQGLLTGRPERRPGMRVPRV